MVSSVFLALILTVGCCSLTVLPEKTSLLRRNRRSLLDLNDMITHTTGKSGADFLGYGNWCGRGGKGKPVDDIDRCCQIHDICYDLAMTGACSTMEKNAVYVIPYEWTQESDEDGCNSNVDECKKIVCNCDAKLAECFGNYDNTYNEANKQKVDMQELLEQLQQITQ